jgi:hypothetical protein
VTLTAQDTKKGQIFSKKKRTKLPGILIKTRNNKIMLRVAFYNNGTSLINPTKNKSKYIMKCVILSLKNKNYSDFELDFCASASS